MKTVTAVINSKALVHNLRHIRSLAPKSKLIAVVKANAYGHGLCQVADVLSGEADALRRGARAARARREQADCAA